MEYYNFLTTPSGRYCEVQDITNEEYLVMVKFIESENYKAFFQCVNEIVIKNIPDFASFNIVDKCYVYMAMCMYSIKGSISINNSQLGEQVVPIALILNNIEEVFHDLTYVYELKKGVELHFKLPTDFEIEDKLPVIDWFSGLYKMNDRELTKEQVNLLKKTLKTKDLLVIEDEIRERFFVEVDLFKGVPMNEMKMGICSESMILNTLFFFKYPLQGFYAEMYSCCKHLKMSFSDFMKRSHVETDIFLQFAKQENEEFSKKDKTGMGRMQQVLND